MSKTILILAAGLFASIVSSANAGDVVVPAGCVAVTITRPAADQGALLRNNMARTVFVGEDIDAGAVKKCNEKARVSEANHHVSTFAAYKPGVGAVYLLPKTGKPALAYFSECRGGTRIYRSADVELDSSKTLALEPSDVSNAGCAS